MLKKLISWLRQPFMAYTTGWHNLPLILGSSVFIFLFLYTFEPFTLHTITDPSYKFRLILGFAVGPPFCVLFMIEGLGRIFPEIYQEKGWTVLSEILFVVGLITLIAICNFINLIYQDANTISHDLEGFIKMLFFTAVTSFFPAVGFVGFRYYRLTKYYTKPAQILPKNDNSDIEVLDYPNTITLLGENNKDKVEFSPQNLYYIESDDNYVIIVFKDGQTLKKELLRSSLSRVESQITIAYIRRCHRSYIVNLQKVSKVSGNAQGYKLHLFQMPTLLPVSRSYAKEIIRQT